jgi:hypothetical protein
MLTLAQAFKQRWASESEHGTCQMVIEKDSQEARAALSAEAVGIAVRVGLLALLAYWSWAIVAPFLTILLWSAILAVALYPVFD